MWRPKTIAVIGVGLLGGSVGLAAKAAHERVKVIGIGRRQASLDRALASGAIDVGVLDTAEGVASAELVVLATPLGMYGPHLAAMSGRLKRGAVVTDVGSTKGLAVKLAESILGPGGPFVGSHPMAGGERKGVEFARADLFRNATCIVTPTAATPPPLVRRVERFWRSLGAVTARMSPRGHDQAVGRVSHLPHLLAALSTNLQTAASLELAGPGFLDTTRIASGDPEMWREIVLANRSAILAALDEADEQLAALRDMLEARDGAAIQEYLASAKASRDKLVARRLRRQE